ncbi:hypothetical protein HanRHA438_Chr09g0373031 [Helianthus annuus]|nr:hypothetical protein HanRHA438_Chr09g0373031 [Helianthus annuus]
MIIKCGWSNNVLPFVVYGSNRHAHGNPQLVYKRHPHVPLDNFKFSISFTSADIKSRQACETFFRRRSNIGLLCVSNVRLLLVSMLLLISVTWFLMSLSISGTTLSRV